MGFISAQSALSTELLPSHGFPEETIDAKDAILVQAATETQDNPDLAWLGATICICSAAVTWGGAYLLIDILFF